MSLVGLAEANSGAGFFQLLATLQLLCIKVTMYKSWCHFVRD